ncbi:MAG: hypothetical protein QOE73_2005 [Verrucomicrobiota bacterium]
MQSMSGIPQGGSAEALVCGMLTGVIIALLFRPLFRRSSQRVFILLPFATLPTAIVIFSVLIWLARQWLGVHSRFVGVSELWEILAIYLIYGLFQYLRAYPVGICVPHSACLPYVAHAPRPNQSLKLTAGSSAINF